jgi:glycosyltransferase involved in cell wall biosynthesis
VTESLLVSVVINVYNGERYLAEAIESVFNQTHRPLELIVVDDGSDDGTAEVAKRYDKADYVHQERGGIGAARNLGVSRTRADYLAFLDADDRFVPDKLERQLAVLVADPEIDMVFGHMSEFLSPDLDPEAAARIRAPVRDAPWRMTNLMLVRRASFERAGGFSTDLKVAVGVDWYARAVDAGLREYVLPKVVLERRIHAANNGLLESSSRPQYLRVLKAHMDRRREADAASDAQSRRDDG